MSFAYLDNAVRHLFGSAAFFRMYAQNTDLYPLPCLDIKRK